MTFKPHAHRAHVSAAETPEGAELHLEQGVRRFASEPYYLPVGDEIEIYSRCHARGLPVMLKGPTGCGKTRFIEHMAWKLDRPLVTIACHDDLSASDLTGRFLIRGEETVWVDGPLTTAARLGAICYLDEIVEARQDTIVVIHPLTDDRRVLPIDKTGELIEAAEGFQLVVSYNPGYQHAIKDLKPSTRQRFVTLEFDFPEASAEAEIVAHESGVKRGTAQTLVDRGRRGAERCMSGGVDRAAHRRSGSRRHHRRSRRRDLLMRHPKGVRRLALKARFTASSVRERVHATIAAWRPVVTLEDVQRRLELFIAALYGAPIPIVPNTQNPSTWLDRASRAMNASDAAVAATPATDGASIHLPREMRADEGAGAALARYRLFAVEQAERILRGTAALASSTDPIVRDLYLVREASAIDARIARDQPGLRALLERERAASLAARPNERSVTKRERAVESIVRESLS